VNMLGATSPRILPKRCSTVSFLLPSSLRETEGLHRSK